jgi:hypothetical protein
MIAEPIALTSRSNSPYVLFWERCKLKILRDIEAEEV